MAAHYSRHGVSLRYPERWELTEQAEPGQVTITISSPGTSFLTLCLFADRPDPQDIVQAALTAFQDEYTEIDVYRSRARVGRRPAIAWDVEFFCLEMTNSARIRAFRAPRFTGLLLYQGTDAEFDRTGPVFEKIERSVRCIPVTPDESPVEEDPEDGAQAD